MVKEYFDDCKIKFEGQYHNGERNGEGIRYDYEGEILPNSTRQLRQNQQTRCISYTAMTGLRCTTAFCRFPAAEAAEVQAHPAGRWL